MDVNEQKLNHKTRIMLINLKYPTRPFFSYFSTCSIGNERLTNTANARSLGLVVNDNMLFDVHVSDICRSSFYQLRNLSKIRNHYSFKIFLRFWLVKTARIIYHNQLLLTKYWTNDDKSAARWKLLNRWRENDVKSAAAGDYWTVDRQNLGTRLCYFGERKNKERNGETPSRTGKYFDQSSFLEYCRTLQMTW